MNLLELTQEWAAIRAAMLRQFDRMDMCIEIGEAARLQFDSARVEAERLDAALAENHRRFDQRLREIAGGFRRRNRGSAA